MWWCSSRQRQQCTARVRLSGGVLEPLGLDHNHPPPTYCITADAIGLKVFSKDAVATLKREFNEKLEKLLSRKKSNSAYFISRSRYEDFISEINIIKTKYHKDFEDYKMLANYDIIDSNGRKKLIKPKDECSSNIKFYVATDELFGVLHTMHILFQHADKDVMDAEIKTKYCNVSKEVIKLYLSCCENCKNKER
ncbi:hypothetical protein evm_005181 [Chilo suppressalis]|nr:hypothetical protein evm_005181 [Chilo suppressalis]